MRNVVLAAGEAISKPFRDLGDRFRGLFNQARDAV
jgi:hypothetical protein